MSDKEQKEIGLCGMRGSKAGQHLRKLYNENLECAKEMVKAGFCGTEDEALEAIQRITTPHRTVEEMEAAMDKIAELTHFSIGGREFSVEDGVAMFKDDGLPKQASFECEIIEVTAEEGEES